MSLNVSQLTLCDKDRVNGLVGMFCDLTKDKEAKEQIPVLKLSFQSPRK